MADWIAPEEQAWKDYREEITAVKVEDGIKGIGDFAFYGFCRLEKVDLPETLTRIGTYAFRGCCELSELKVPEGVKLIGSKTFEKCGKLRTLYLPATLRNIDMRAFIGADALRDVYYAGTVFQWGRVRISLQSGANDNLLKKAAIHYGAISPAVYDLYDDVEKEGRFTESIQYLTDHGWIEEKNGSFGVGLPAEPELVLDMLYRRAGTPGMYASPREWAEDQGLAGRAQAGVLSGETLLDILARAAGYNGYRIRRDQIGPELGKEIGGTQPLSRGEVCEVMAAYMRSRLAQADRYDEMAERIRSVAAREGDGKLHIITPGKFNKESIAASRCGDCTVILFPRGKRMMIDSAARHAVGPVLQFLKDTGIEYLDYYVLSHPHSDHVGGALPVAEYLYSKQGEGCIKEYYASRFSTDEEKEFREYLENVVKSEIHNNVSSGDGRDYKFPEIDGVSVDIYNPTEACLKLCEDGLKNDVGVNGISIAMKFTYGESTYLTGGDIYIKRERELAAERGGLLRADVMKTNHHGTHASSSREWLDAVRPVIAVSDSDDNGSQTLVEEYARRGAAFYSEGLDGMIIVDMDDAKGYRVYTQHDSYLREDYRGNVGRKDRQVKKDQSGRDGRKR